MSDNKRSNTPSSDWMNGGGLLHLPSIAGRHLPYCSTSSRSRCTSSSLQSTLEIIDAALAVVEGCPYSNSANIMHDHHHNPRTRRPRSLSTSSSNTDDENTEEEEERMEPPKQ